MTQINPYTKLVGSVVICLAAVLLTTSVLWTLDHFRPTRYLLLGYLLLIIFAALFFGGILAFMTVFACGLAAAYFLLPPQFSFYIDDPAQVDELVWTMILAAVAVSSVVSLLRVRGRTENWWPP